MEYKQKRDFVVNTLFVVSVIITIIGFCFALKTIAPFVIGFLVALMLKPITDRITKNAKIKRKYAAIFVISFFYICVIACLYFIGILIYSQSVELFKFLPSFYTDKLEPVIFNMNNKFYGFVQDICPTFGINFWEVFESASAYISQMIKDFSSKILSSLGSIFTQIPLYFLTLVFSIVSSVLITIDYKDITAFIFRQIPHKAGKALLELKCFLSETLIKLIKAYIIIFFITFLQLSLGFFLLKVPYYLSLGLIISALDILPFLGIGGALIPWSLWSFASGDALTGSWLLVLYLLVTAIRNIVEPKIIGNQIGLHPLVTIIAMYSGLVLFGFVGMFIMPIVVLVVIYLNSKGMINLYKE
ncbi:MAG: sporulation integral membrane protein YtvI [Oscillospiraceae bacterium]